MLHFFKKLLLLLLLLRNSQDLAAQTSLILNGGFEDINTCTEYQSECGVEGWFYLKDVKAQMLANETNSDILGANSFGIYYTWNGYTGFTPVMGTLLPCALRKGNTYTFRGMISVRLNPQLIFKPGICTGDHFYVPRRPFAKDLLPDSIVQVEAVPDTKMFRFSYTFTATGKEQYLTFGAYISEDTAGAKKKLIGVQTISLLLDNFQLIPSDSNESPCDAFAKNKNRIYHYDFRHRDMDYALYGKGQLPVEFRTDDSSAVTRIIEPAPPPVPDTLKLGDVLFDFNKALLKPAAITALHRFFFTADGNVRTADSIFIEGHTDSVGSDQRNNKLSQDRCAAVKDWLLLNNVLTESQLHITAFGRSRPVATNQTADGRARNRRVELLIYRKKE